MRFDLGWFAQLLALSILSFSAVIIIQACAAMTPQKIEDVAQETAHVACILANDFLPNEKAIAEACALDDSFFNMIRLVVSASNASDAGVDAGTSL